MSLKFVKMHGLGNDFAIFDARGGKISFSTSQIRKIADRRFGIGCDQVIVIEAGKGRPLMRIYNADGSEAGACGNASRCVGALLMAENNANTVAIDTISTTLEIMKNNDQITVDMGEVRTGWKDIPLAREMDTLAIPVNEGELKEAVGINVGNPHAVFFVQADLAVWGSKVEHSPLFPERTNVELVEIINRTHLKIRVWERGAGITMACGSGACAALAASVRKGLCERKATVSLDGGDLEIEWRESDNHIVMTGAVEDVYRGEIDLK